MKSIEIIPTNTSPKDVAQLTSWTEELKIIASWIQLDLDDGRFVPVTSWPYQSGQWAELEQMAETKSLPYAENVNYEVHLMLESPLEIGELLARAGAKRIIPHVEAFTGAESCLAAFSAWKRAGAEDVGLAVRMDTSLSTLEPLIAHCDVVQLMSIAQLGKQGAAFEPSVIPRIQELHTSYPDIVIAVDGGVSESNIVELARAGATRFGVGSAISKAKDPKLAYERLKTLAENALQ